jgi:hypothetical protein
MFYVKGFFLVRRCFSMKNLLFYFLGFLLITSNYVHAMMAEDHLPPEIRAAFARIRPVAEQLPRVDPHHLDKQVEERVPDVRTVFPHFFPGVVLVEDKEATYASFLEFIDQNMGADASTLRASVERRKEGDHHSQLLSMLLHCYEENTTGVKSALAHSCEPTNGSQSAIYNLWFVKVVQALNELDQAREEQHAFEAGRAAYRERRAAREAQELEEIMTAIAISEQNQEEQHQKAQTYASDEHPRASSGRCEPVELRLGDFTFTNPGGGATIRLLSDNTIEVRGQNRTTYSQLQTEPFRRPKGGLVSGTLWVDENSSVGVGLLGNDQQWVVDPKYVTFRAHQEPHTFELPIYGSEEEMYRLVFTNENRPDRMANFIVVKADLK